ncbi:MAG: hypothetical protein WEA09_13570 [Gemmatimonadota bacterium]
MRADLRSRLIMALAALVLLPAFITPLWSIGLVAPQYPDGLGMHIYVHDVRGHHRHDLQNINILNHYIGMQAIEPESIPELDIMPKVLAALVLSGLLAAALGRPRIMAAWLLAFLGAGVAGMVDFYLWNIDYGHNLSPDAPIRIPDMTYSPPILGTTQLLNIRASSYPGLGTLFLAVGAGLAAWAILRAFRRPGNRQTGTHSPSAASPSTSGRSPSTSDRSPGVISVLVMGAFLALGAGACQAPGEAAAGAVPGSREARDTDAQAFMDFDGSTDPFCQIPVEAVRWGGLLETRNGEVHRFATAACLAGFLLRGDVSESEVARLAVVDFAQGWKLVDPAQVHFLHTPNLKSPTGPPNIMAIETDKMAVNLQAAYAGRLMGWDEVLQVAASNWDLPAPVRKASAPYVAPRP